KLHHTNIVPVFGVGEHEGTSYYVMQFIQGQGLDAVLAELKRLRGRPPLPAAAPPPSPPRGDGVLEPRPLVGQAPLPPSPLAGEGWGEGDARAPAAAFPARQVSLVAHSLLTGRFDVSPQDDADPADEPTTPATVSVEPRATVRTGPRTP